jgi:hypothetical protein
VLGARCAVLDAGAWCSVQCAVRVRVRGASAWCECVVRVRGAGAGAWCECVVRVRVRAAGRGVQDAGRRTRGAGCGAQDAGCRMRGAGRGVQDAGGRTRWAGLTALCAVWVVSRLATEHGARKPSTGTGHRHGAPSTPRVSPISVGPLRPEPRPRESEPKAGLCGGAIGGISSSHSWHAGRVATFRERLRRRSSRALAHPRCSL